MYHTEGFVNKYTINAEEHIIVLTLEIKGRPWYLWCVIKEAVATTKSLEQVLSFWLKQTLLTNGCTSRAATQRELNRLGSYLQKEKCEKTTVGNIALFMYYQGQFYQWDSELWSGKIYAECVKVNQKQYREIARGIYAYISVETLWEQCEICDFKWDALANEWERCLLEACILGKIEQGFFMIWEDICDV